MEDFTVRDILEAADGRLMKGDPSSLVKGISTDSRTLKRDDFFVALAGERFDGHDFIAQAVERGASGLVVSRDVGEIPVGNVVLVENTLQALGDIAGFYRSRFKIPIVGITGSNGKTTTKDMTASVLLRKYRVLMNQGNLNNAIGVPLTLFRLSRTHEIAVTEMGTGAPGEMSRLVEIAQPDVAVVTNVGPTHLEFFGSVDKVAVEKAILVQAAGSAVLNADDPRVAKMRQAFRKSLSKKESGEFFPSQAFRKRPPRTRGESVAGKAILFGLSENPPNPLYKGENQVSGESLSKREKDVLAAEVTQDQYGRPEFTLITPAGSARVHLPSLGRHNVYNALAAASVGVLLQVEIDEIKKGLESYEGTPMRMQEMLVNGAMIINDTYNSNPVSLKAAVDFLAEMECYGKKVAVLGDMLELGERSDDLHREAGRFIAGRPIHILMTVGDKSSRIAEAALSNGVSKDRVFICETNLEAAAGLHAILGEGDIVLIKGSRGVKMEEILEELRK